VRVFDVGWKGRGEKWEVRWWIRTVCGMGCLHFGCRAACGERTEFGMGVYEWCFSGEGRLWCGFGWSVEMAVGGLGGGFLLLVLLFGINVIEKCD
jgi:hypothetical protein